MAMTYLLFVLVLLFPLAATRAAVFQSEPKGFSAGNTNIQLTAPAENLIYGVIGPSTAGSFILLQNGSGVDKFRVDNAGNLTAAGFVKGSQLCIQGDCRASWAAASPTPTLQAVTTAGASSTNNLDLRGSISNSTGDLVVNDWVDVQWGLKNSSANNGGKLYVADDAQIAGNLRMTPGNNVEGVYIVSSNYSPLVVRNSADNADLFRVDQSGNASVGGTLTVSGITAANAGITVDGQTVIDDGAGWHRTYGATGWYNGTYGGGWYMSDATWIRSYGSKSVYSDQGIRAEGGLAGGSYNPDATHLVTTPTLYAEQGQVGGATGGLKGVGTMNAVQLCIQGDCRANWAAASPTPSLQAVTDVGATTNRDISTGSIGAGVYVSAGNSGNRVRLGELNSRGGLYTEGETWLQSGANKTVFSDPSNNPQMTLTGANLNINGQLTTGGKLGIDGNGVNPGFSLNASNIRANNFVASTDITLQNQWFNITTENPFYLNANGNLQLRFDANGNGSGGNTFTINNGANNPVLTVNELGDLSSLRNITASGDAYLTNNKSLRIDNSSVNTSLVVGNYGDGGGFSYGTGKTASLAVEGDVKGNQLCIKEDCKPSWSAIGNVSGWTLSGNNLYPNNTAYNVGIGNAAPGYKLDVQGGSVNASAGLCINGDCRPSWAAVSNASGWTDDGTAVRPTTNTDQVSIGTASPTPSYSLTVDKGPNVSAMAISGGVDIANGNLRVTSGNVGIGSSNAPGYRLAVVDDGATSIVNLDSDDAARYYSGLRVARQGSEKWFVGIDNSTDKLLLRRAASSNDVVVDTNGYVGIGTATPNKQLHIKTASGNAELDIQSVNSAYWAIYQDDASDQLRFWNNNVSSPPGNKDVLTLDDNGYVGIGTVTPGSFLHLVGDAGASYLAQIQSPNDSANLVLVTNQLAGDYAIVGFRRGNISGTGWNAGLGPADDNFHIQSRIEGSFNYDKLVIDAFTGYVKAIDGLCLGTGSVCKTKDAAEAFSWGAKSTAYPQGGETNPYNPVADARVYKVLGSGFDGLDYFCDPGYVVIGLRNTTPGQLICGKMW